MTAHRTDELTIGELARRSGVSTSALRFYERQGLLTSRRTGGNQRRYPDTVLGDIAFIRAAQRLGIALGPIRDVLALVPPGAAGTPQVWARASACWRADLDARAARLTGLREQLAECAECDCPSLTRCTLVRSAE
ncbi:MULTISPECIES: redox-sensitive transcriptional activator SoxR [unclassified Nocardia]|uniref:redox-sensitive transcriptional activator SoxR n=1 Tax=unclassified Nocardia TaxID=2637762 RepID=UPI001CE418A9|nr:MULTISPECIES: redox-sensitive transcriptional activator SoxR [unclassified Nocardia]